LLTDSFSPLAGGAPTSLAFLYQAAPQTGDAGAILILRFL